MTPEQYCRNKVLTTGSSLYYSLLYLPDDKKAAVTAIHAFCREASEVITASDPAIAHSKLSWWRSEIDRCFNEQAQHPVSKALQTPLQSWNLPQEYFHEILDGVQMDLEQHQYQTFNELGLYCYRLSGTTGLLTAEIYGYQHRDTLKYAQTLGTAFKLTHILRNTHRDTQHGHLYIPTETLQKFDVTTNELLQNTTPEKLQALFEYLTQQASKYYHQAFELLPDHDRYSQTPGLIQTAINQALLSEIRKDNYRILNQRVSLTPVRKFWIAWKTNRREKRNHRA